jgi:hypothetical protein
VVARSTSHWLVAIGLTTSVAGCLRNTAFHCENDQACVTSGAAGKCELTGYCSIPDPMCAGGSRYVDSAGSYAGTCVGGGDGDNDGGVDTNQTTGDGGPCYGTGTTMVCVSDPPAMLTLSSPINTDTDPACLAAYPNVCAIAAVAVTVTGTVPATGSKPLVLVAVNTLTINGTLNASSVRGGMSGAGSRGECTAAVGSPDQQGAGGGAGGTFGGRGGNGGRGDAQDSNVNGGTAPAVTAQTMLVGGCGGSAGGNSGVTGGPGGRSGGAIYLIAGSTISISGNVYASGAGGTGAGTNAGGGGGGSGGMIGLDAPTFTVTGRLSANGGGGGAGGGNGGSPNDNGEDGSTTDTNPASGGNGGGGGTDGGDGAADTTLNGSSADDADGGGGGGGGGGGIIRVFPPRSLGGTVSPPET